MAKSNDGWTQEQLATSNDERAEWLSWAEGLTVEGKLERVFLYEGGMGDGKRVGYAVRYPDPDTSGNTLYLLGEAGQLKKPLRKLKLGTTVRIACKGKVKLPNGMQAWNFELAHKGDGTGPQVVSVLRDLAAEGDDLPF